MIIELKRLWKQAFGDPEDFVDVFFATGYSPDRCRYLTVDGHLAAALYWFDCSCRGEKIAYIYGVATDVHFQKQGLCRKLMEQTHAQLRKQGYAGAVLVPGSKTLFTLYEKLGYRTCSHVAAFSCEAGTPIPLCPIDTAAYAALRLRYLPAGGVLQEGVTLDFLAAFARFYAGDGFVLATTPEGKQLYIHELLGTADAAGIVAALGAKTGRVRTPGNEVPFAMYYGFTTAPPPAYFGLALD